MISRCTCRADAALGHLQGWPADSQGNILSNGSSLSSLRPVNVQTISGSVAATMASNCSDMPPK